MQRFAKATSSSFFTPNLIQVWSRAVGLVMEDAQLQASEPWKTPSPDLGRIAQLVIHRTQDWVKSTAGKLSVLLKKIVSCTSAHQHWRVRLEMVELADHLLARCSKSLGECVGLLLEALVGAVNDEEPRVKERFDLIDIFVSKKNKAQRNFYKMFIETPLFSSHLGVRLLSERYHGGIRAIAAAVILPASAAVLRTSLMCFQKISTLWRPPYPD